MSRSLPRALVCALVLLIAASAWAAAPPTRFIDKLHADVSAGKITADDAVVYEAIAIDQPDLLPRDYAGTDSAPSAHCGSEIVFDLARNVKSAHPEVRNFVKYLLGTPHKRLKMKTPAIKSAPVSNKDLANRAIANAASTASTASILVTAHFKIDYTGASIAYAKSVGTALETSWSSEVDSQGFNAPQSPNDGLIDIFLVQQPALCVFGLGCGVDGIAIPGDLSLLVGGDGDPAIRIKVGLSANVVQATAAHEFFHLVQYEMAGFLNMGQAWF